MVCLCACVCPICVVTVASGASDVGAHFRKDSSLDVTFRAGRFWLSKLRLRLRGVIIPDGLSESPKVLYGDK